MPKDNDMTSAKKLIIHLIAELMMSFSDVTLIDKKQREWSYNAPDEEEKFCKELAEANIQVHAIRNKQRQVSRWVAISKIRATTNIPDWKQNDYFCDQVIESKTYMFPHPFGYDNWDISNIGFIKNIHAVHFPSDHLHNIISEQLQTQDHQPPTFQLVPQKITNQDKTATTRAYVVQCNRSDTKRLSQLLTQGGFRNTQMFVPFRYKRQQSSLFTKCLQQQNEVYYKTWIIKLEGISKEMMHFLSADILKHNGVSHIVPTKHHQKRGEWKVLVDQSRSFYIHRQLTEEWQRMMANVPQNFLDQAPSEWATPRISSQKIREYQDDASDIDSYGSLLTNGTTDSIMTFGDESLNELPTDYRFPSYAEAVKTPTKIIEATRTSPPTVSDLTEWHKEKQELEAQLKTQAAIIEKFQEEQAKLIQNLQSFQAQQIAELKAEQARQIEKLQTDIQMDIQSRDQDPLSSRSVC